MRIFFDSRAGEEDLRFEVEVEQCSICGGWIVGRFCGSVSVVSEQHGRVHEGK